MTIPETFILNAGKLRYLLEFRRKDDKSKYLGQAGFGIDAPHLLEVAIRAIVKSGEAVPDRTSAYGAFYTLRQARRTAR